MKSFLESSHQVEFPTNFLTSIHVHGGDLDLILYANLLLVLSLLHLIKNSWLFFVCFLFLNLKQTIESFHLVILKLADLVRDCCCRSTSVDRKMAN
jgi:hypothetical protein